LDKKVDKIYIFATKKGIKGLRGIDGIEGYRGIRWNDGTIER